MGPRFPVPHLKHRGRLGRSAGRCRSLGARLALAAVVASWALVVHAAPLKPKSSKARKHFDKAVELYKTEDYDGAAAEASAGLAIEDHESLLFILAQAERQRGNCVVAVDLYGKFIETTESDGMRQNALAAKELCDEELAELERQAELARQEAELAAAAEEEPDAEPTQPPPPKPARPWYRDPLGGVLVGVGGAGVLAGGAVLVTAAVLSPGSAPDYGTFDERRQLRPTLLLAGGLTMGVGALVGAGGAVRWAFVAKKNKGAVPEAARLKVAPWLDPRRTGVVLTGRF
jgi:hypothetical protein